jgi:hypothetical protein
MIRKFGSIEAFNRVKASHGLIPRGAEVGLDASIGFTQEILDKRIQSSTLNSHRLINYITQKYATATKAEAGTSGLKKVEAVYDELNKKHFLDNRILNDKELLIECISSPTVGKYKYKYKYDMI